MKTNHIHNATLIAFLSLSISCGGNNNIPVEEMVEVPGGEFMMGCNTAFDADCRADEFPYHRVTVPPFKIDRYEVMLGAFKKCIDAGVCIQGAACINNPAGWDFHPVNCASWEQARTYCAWRGKRLPSEAEWELAARGTDGRKYPWGNSELVSEHAVVFFGDCTQQVGSKPIGASPYGAMDMIGNVWEWVEDDYHSNFNGAPANGAPWICTPDRCPERVMKSGDCFSYGEGNDHRISRRFPKSPDASTWTVEGFRCAK
ncbi:MAG: formylglycine-generating enzyme family protein [Myxococcota bacterium]